MLLTLSVVLELLLLGLGALLLGLCVDPLHQLLYLAFNLLTVCALQMLHLGGLVHHWLLLLTKISNQELVDLRVA
jgi:hypothetical protein